MSVSAETTFQYDSGPPVAGGRLATWLFLCAEGLFFGGLISAWLVLRSQTPTWAVGHGPSIATGVVMTVILLSASFMGHTAIGAAERAQHKQIAARIALAGLLAFAFLCVQVLEYGKLDGEGIGPASSLRWGAFYALTLCHGLHVLIGVLWLGWLLLKAAGPGLEAEKRAPLEYGVLYLHFVDAIWLVLLVLLYFIK